MKEIDKLNYRPFTRFCMSIGAVPTSYLAGLTIEEQLLWLCSYLEKKVIPAVNNNGEAVEELQNLYVELKSYVDNYFDNLDVQEEINNKLDAMVEDGTFDEIINQEIFNELNDKVNANATSIENIENDNEQKLTGGKIIFEIPYISHTNYTDIYYGCNSAIQISENNNDYIIVSSSASFNDNNYQKYDVLNLDSETKSVVYKEFTGSHSLGMFYKDNKIYDLLKNNEIKVYTTTALTDSDTITLTYNLHAIAYDNDNDNLYGIRIIDNNFNLVKINDDFSENEVIDLHFTMRSGDVIQNFTYYKNALYMVFSNTLVKINLTTFEIEEQLNSLLSNCEYEDLVVVNDKPCILLQCGNEQAGFVIAQTNIDNNNYIYDNNFFRIQYKEIFVNSSASGFYEDGLRNTRPIHNSLWASCLATSRNIHRIVLCGNTNALYLQGWNGHIVSNDNTKYEVALAKTNNAVITLEKVTLVEYKNYGTYITYGSYAINNSKLYFFNSIINVDTHPYEFLSCDISINGGDTRLSHKCKYYNCRFRGDSDLFANALPVAKMTTGVTAGEYVTSDFDNTNFGLLLRAGLYCIELATTSSGSVSIYLLGHNSTSHRGTLYASGVDDNGRNVICRIGASKDVIACKYADDNTPLYVKNINIMPV